MTKLAIENALKWHSNRQDMMKRAISQKLGTVYTLKDYFSSSTLFRSHTIKQVLKQQDLITRKPQLIQGRVATQGEQKYGKRGWKMKPKQARKLNKSPSLKIADCSAELYVKSILQMHIILKELNHIETIQVEQVGKSKEDDVP